MAQKPFKKGQCMSCHRLQSSLLLVNSSGFCQKCIDLNREWLGQINQRREDERRLAHERRMAEEQRRFEREEAERRREHELQEKERLRRHTEIESRRLIETEKLKLQQLQEQRAMAESLMNCDSDKLSQIRQILELHLQEKMYNRSIGQTCKYLRPEDVEYYDESHFSRSRFKSRSSANVIGNWNTFA